CLVRPPMTTPFNPLTPRREMLRRTAIGFGSIGLGGRKQAAGLLCKASAATSSGTTGLHFAPRAKRVIYLFMNGGPSHVDTFDPKPALAKYAGQPPSGDLFKKTQGTGFMPSPFSFAKHGQCGIEISESLPHLGGMIDDCCVI